MQNELDFIKTQGSGGVPIPGGVQKMCRCGTLGYGLVGMVVLGGRLDLMILEVFSNLWFYDLSLSLRLWRSLSVCRWEPWPAKI